MIIRIIKWIFIAFGGLFLILFSLSFTTLPFWTWYNLSVRKAGIHATPEYIVVLGGGGIPSETGLMRTWHAARLGNHFTHSKLIVALPGNIKDSLSSVSLMKKELVDRGITPERIMIEDSGTNTRSQALLIFEKLSRIKLEQSAPGNRLLNSGNKNPEPPKTINPRLVALIIVSSPEHINRAVLTFRQAGFIRVDGFPAFDNAIESDITFLDKRLGGRRWIPELGNNLTVRYNFWSQLRYEELVIREYFAIAYYWLKGWI
jgi:uncharacterized SAM-binding protein YcdF (DUF218 family)